MRLPASLSGSVVSLLLTLTMAGQSLLTQHLSGIDMQGLILMDIAAALLLVLLCSRGLLRAMSLLQSLFSLFCLSYASCMGMPPTLAAVLHGSKQILGMDLRSLYSYLSAGSRIRRSLLSGSCSRPNLFCCGNGNPASPRKPFTGGTGTGGIP